MAARKSRLTSFWTVIFFVAFFLCSVSAGAQCAMCRAALESEGDVAKAEAVNDGIVYLMIIPYVIVAGIAFGVYKLRQKKTAI